MFRVSHTKTALVGTSLSIPITNGSLNLGTWQGDFGLWFVNPGDDKQFDPCFRRLFDWVPSCRPLSAHCSNDTVSVYLPKLRSWRTYLWAIPGRNGWSGQVKVPVDPYVHELCKNRGFPCPVLPRMVLVLVLIVSRSNFLEMESRHEWRKFGLSGADSGNQVSSIILAMHPAGVVWYKVINLTSRSN